MQTLLCAGTWCPMAGSTAPECCDPVDMSNVSGVFLPVSRLQAKYKGCLGKREYKKKREAGMSSGIEDSLLGAMLSSRSCSFGRSRIHVAADSAHGFTCRAVGVGVRCRWQLCEEHSQRSVHLLPPCAALGVTRLWEQSCAAAAPSAVHGEVFWDTEGIAHELPG